MHIDPDKSSYSNLLEPYDRLSEILLGLVMVLTFTCSLSVAQVGRQDIQTMLQGAIGCNMAWGIIDGFFYCLGLWVTKGIDLKVYRAVRAATDPKVAQDLIAGALPPVVASVMEPADFSTLHARLKKLPEPPKVRRLTKQEWMGGLAIFFLVFLSTFPVVLPFIFMQDALLALRVSNLIALLLLFLVGWRFGQYAGRSPLWVGIFMTLVGSAFVGVALLLGG